MRLKPPSQILICFALMVLGWAQVFGMSRGYVCDCGGQVQITMFDHCHGPHGEACHSDAPVSHQHDDEEGDDSHKHSPLKEPVQAKQLASQASAVPMPVMAVVTVLEPLTMLLVVNDPVQQPLPPPRAPDDGRRWTVLLTHSIALRI